VSGIRRRDFVILVAGGAAAAWPLAARAQQRDRTRRIGVLMPASADDAESQTRVGAFLWGRCCRRPARSQSCSRSSARRDLLAAAQAMGKQLIVLDVSSDLEIETAFTTLIQRGAGALHVGTGAFMLSHRGLIVALAARHRVPAIYNWREAVVAGGLLSYAPSITDAYRQAGIYAGRILKGEKPAELPVQLPTKFELVINLKTAKELGIQIPDKLLALADEVIE
jgi:ABC-type uncharacterized transport system substrate-binding protein